MAELKGAERRLHERKPLRGTAQLVFPSQPPLEVRTWDISAGGIAIIASANPPPKLRCVIRFVVPLLTGGGTPVEVKVQVAHSVLSSNHGAFMVGLQFEGLSAAGEQAVARFLKGQ
ncbi:PilZ domain-containing protein [Ideonella azotifigens]|uniref:PilZ domain-containing protein n=1 Tax=Ideonella azotifigens TaxID=513160 RepID=A0ABP3V3M4_9BURK|nr:PilZ domain-containing protein [Ideonella azotifigens]MCD2340944.1 PilZ domain-containing protein [Ideonella azotifigens]